LGHYKRLELRMRRPWCWLWVMWWVHAGRVHWLHGHWRIVVVAIVVLHWRLMMVGVVASVVVPCSTVVIKMILVVVLFVVHLQLAHRE
jgi:hypothetical protein